VIRRLAVLLGAGLGLAVSAAAAQTPIDAAAPSPAQRSTATTAPPAHFVYLRRGLESGGSWFACNERPIGSLLTVRFASLVAFTANLPAVVRPSGSSAHAVAVNTISVSGARELTLWVDTSLAQVVGVRPMAWPMTPGPGPATTLATVSPAHDQGGPVTPSCWQSAG
jgi:hypothetical protein